MALVELEDNQAARMPFNSTNKFALSIVHSRPQDEPDHAYTVLIKGAPEKIWTFCSSLLLDGRHTPIDEEWQKKFSQINLDLGKRGERVLGFA